MSVYLCGFMGCGKSHIGRMLAKRLSMSFIDLDKYIVNAEKMTIPEIFDKFGEPHFRELEAKYIRELANGCVVATGGGALINDETARYAKESGISKRYASVIFLPEYTGQGQTADNRSWRLFPGKSGIFPRWHTSRS